MSDVADVVIVGGGPAGCAAGLSLRSHAPGLSVVLVEGTGYEEPRIGETLSPLAGRLLRHLGIWDAFLAGNHSEVYGTAAAWGDAVPHENDFLFNAGGNGWHLDRTAFDALLAAEAERRGVQVLRRTRLIDSQDGWRLRLSNGDELTARYVIDATGSAAAFARRRGARFVASDRLTGFARFFEDREDRDPRTLVEAFAEGWWYTSGLPGGARIVACLTDSDLARRLKLTETAAWSSLLDSTDRVKEALRGAEPQSPVLVRATPSRRLDPAVGEGWLAVGDAASLFDPLSSSGILKGLRSGVFASYAVGDLLTKGDDRGLRRYRKFLQEEFESYSRMRARYYSEERRWPGSEFWQRRGSPGLSPGNLRVG